MNINWWFVMSLLFLAATFVLSLDFNGGEYSWLYPISRSFSTASIVSAVIGLAAQQSNNRRE